MSLSWYSPKGECYKPLRLRVNGLIPKGPDTGRGCKEESPNRLVLYLESPDRLRQDTRVPVGLLPDPTLEWIPGRNPTGPIYM